MQILDNGKTNGARDRVWRKNRKCRNNNTFLHLFKCLYFVMITKVSTANAIVFKYLQTETESAAAAAFGNAFVHKVGQVAHRMGCAPYC